LNKLKNYIQSSKKFSTSTTKKNPGNITHFEKKDGQCEIDKKNSEITLKLEIEAKNILNQIEKAIKNYTSLSKH
jgi:hypothetical protein